MGNVLDIAEYTLWYCETTLGEPISNLQLQKFLYYEQGIYLAMYSKPLFENEIQAWRYGPVVPDVYYWFNINLSNKIRGGNNTSNKLEKEAIDVIEYVADELISISPFDLVEQTHREAPWKEAYIKGFNEVILPDTIREFFIENCIEK